MKQQHLLAIVAAVLALALLAATLAAVSMRTSPTPRQVITPPGGGVAVARQL